MRFLAAVCREKNAGSITGKDLRKTDGVIIDGFVICSGLSEKHVSSIAEHVRIRLKEMGEPVRHVEGESMNSWVLVDCGDIVLHIFLDRIRDFYRLEDLWSHTGTFELPDVEPSGSLQTEEL